MGQVLVDLLVYLVGAGLIAGLARWWRRGELPWRWIVLHAVAALLFVGPALLTPRHQVVTDVAYAWKPWHETLPGKVPGDGEVQGSAVRDGKVVAANPLLVDPLLQMYPFRSMARRHLLAGEIPLWAHELGTGQPFLGNAQSSLFAPLHLLALPLPPLRAMTVAAAWQLLLALLLTHALLRRLGCGDPAAAVAAFAYAFSTFLVVWLYYPLGATAAWLPGVVLGALALRAGERGALAGTVTVAVGMALSGHPETLAHGALVAAVVAAIGFLRPAPGGRWRHAGRLAAAGVLAICLAAPALLPVLDTLPESQRTAVLKSDGPASLSPPFEASFLRPLVDPLAFGSPRDGDWQGPWNFNELCSGYAGLTVLALALAGALWLRGRVAAVVAGGALALAAAFGLQPVDGLLRGLPLLGAGAHGRLRLVWVLALAVAAGLTLDRLASREGGDGSAAGLRRAAAAALAGGAGALLLLPPPGAAWQHAWWLVTVGGALLLAGTVLLPAARRRAAWVALVVVAADLCLLGVRYNPALGPLWRLGTPGEDAAPPPALAILVERASAVPEPVRVAAEGWDFLPNLPALWGLWDPRGNDPMRPAAAARYVRSRLEGQRRPESWALARPGHIDYRGGYDRLAVRYLLTPHRRNMPPPWRLVAADVGGRVWENGAAVGLFFVPPAVRPAADPATAWRLTADLADPVRVAIVEGIDRGRRGQRGEVAVDAVESNGFRLRVASRDGVVVASSVSHSRHWRARLADGATLTPLRVHAAFLGFAVPPGEHRVELTYAPPGWPRGLLLAALAMLALAALALWRRRRAAAALLALAPVLFLAGCAETGGVPRPTAAPPTDSGGPLDPEQAAYDVRHYDLALEVDPAERSIRGALTVRARLLDELSALVLDLDPPLAIAGATMDGAEMAVERDGGRVRIGLGRTLPAGREVTVTVRYGGQPRQAAHAPWEGGFVWARDGGGAPWIGVACEVDGADVWWPVKDHPSDEPEDGMDLRFTLPRDLVVASNGRLVGVETVTPEGRRGRWRRWHWRVDGPINAYAVTLNAARYRTVERRVKGAGGAPLELTYWVLPDDLREVEEHLPELLRQVAFLEDLLGPYPFAADKLGFAETPYLAMENQSVVALGRSAWSAEHSGFPFLPLHELAHEWFGNRVSAADWSDLWIHEGFASYLEALYAERREGAQAYRAYMRRVHLPGMHDRRPLAPSGAASFRQVHDEGGGDVYGKGAWVLHTLRWLLGDQVFFEALRQVSEPEPPLATEVGACRCRSETTAGVRRVFERVSGRDLGWFFDVYLRRAELPRLVSEVVGGRLVLSWEAPDGLPFPMPVEVELPDGERLRLQVPEGGAVIEGPWREARPVIDPDTWVLRQALLDD